MASWRDIEKAKKTAAEQKIDAVLAIGGKSRRKSPAAESKAAEQCNAFGGMYDFAAGICKRGK